MSLCDPFCSAYCPTFMNPTLTGGVCVLVPSISRSVGITTTQTWVWLLALTVAVNLRTGVGRLGAQTKAH